MAISHGSILCGTVATPNLDAALIDYRDRLGLSVIDRSPISDQLAASWDTPALSGAQMAVLQPTAGSQCFIRLVEQPLPNDFRPTRTYGWAAFEMTVQSVYDWPGKLIDSGFEIVGPPREIKGLEHIIAMQMIGAGQEMIYLNEVRADTPTSDLPRAQSPVDKIFICILAGPDRAKAVSWYCDNIVLDEGETFSVPYSSINRAFDLPVGHHSSLTMVHKGRMPIIEIDEYPELAMPRELTLGYLPPGNSMLTLAIKDLDQINVEFIAPPQIFSDSPYSKMRSATVRGPVGELLELVEIP